MSKNEQMRAETPVVIGADRDTAGPASLVQGVYGARGNLEAVAPDAHDGIWVFWFNADRPEDLPASPDVPPGAWSAGLRFAAGTAYREAVILQSTAGPDHLEVLAVTRDGALVSWWWSPGPGFRRRPADVVTGVERIAAEHDAGALRVSVADAAGRIRYFVSEAEPYPEREWTASPSGPALRDERIAQRVLAGAGIGPVDPDTARVARSDREGGTLELTWRSAGVLHHLGVPA